MFNNVIMLVLTRLYRRGATLSVIIYFECMEPAKSPPVPLKNDAHTTLGLESRLNSKAVHYVPILKANRPLKITSTSPVESAVSNNSENNLT